MICLLKRWNFIILGTVLILLNLHCNQDTKNKIPITTSSPKALKQFLKGRELFEKLRLQESSQYFKEALELDSNFALARLNYAITQPTIKGFFEELNQAVSLVDQVSEGERLMILGLEAAVNGFSMKEHTYYQRLVEIYSRDERAHNLLGNYYFTQQDFNLAIKHYRIATEINPKFSQPYNQLGYSHRYLENFDEAEEAFKQYIKLIPNDPNPYDSYAELLMKMGLFEESINTYKKALKIDSNFVASHIGIANNLMFLERHNEAREQLNTLFNIARNEGEKRAAKFTMALTYIDESDIDKAIDEFNWLYNFSSEIDDYGNMAQDLTNMGNIFLEQAKPEQAISKYKRALHIIENSNLSEEIKENAKHLFLYFQAKVAIQKNDLNTAKALSEKYSQWADSNNNRPLIRLAHQLKGMIAFKSKKYDEALGEFNRSNLQDPYNLFRISMASKEKGETWKAKEFCHKAAHHNTLNSLDYAFIRKKAQKELTKF